MNQISEIRNLNLKFKLKFEIYGNLSSNFNLSCCLVQVEIWQDENNYLKNMPNFYGIDMLLELPM